MNTKLEKNGMKIDIFRAKMTAINGAINSEQTSLTIKRIEWETKWQLIAEIKA